MTCGVRQNHSSHGLYHVVPTGATSWYNYANYVINSHQALGEVFVSNNLTAISNNSYSARAQRPANSRLDTQKKFRGIWFGAARLESRCVVFVTRYT